jgi:lipoprotein NlpD
VLKGDTMYSIAFYYGLDYHELAELNGLKDPSVIQVGQVLRLFAAPGKGADAKSDSKSSASGPKDQPKVVKYAYSQAAMAKIDGVQTGGTTSLVAASGTAKPSTYTVPGATIEVTSLPHKGEVVASSAKPAAVVPNDGSAIINTEEDTLQWALPATGKIVGQFSETENRKGIDIAGKLGQEILASAPGKVVYSGSGLRGYGKLIIIKHNKTYLSAYAHNDKVLVKEGQMVKRGEKIAEMGKTDADQVKLHFEVRRLGKPVDPAKYLPKV